MCGRIQKQAHRLRSQHSFAKDLSGGHVLLRQPPQSPPQSPPDAKVLAASNRPISRASSSFKTQPRASSSWKLGLSLPSPRDCPLLVSPTPLLLYLFVGALIPLGLQSPVSCFYSPCETGHFLRAGAGGGGGFGVESLLLGNSGVHFPALPLTTPISLCNALNISALAYMCMLGGDRLPFASTSSALVCLAGWSFLRIPGAHRFSLFSLVGGKQWRLRGSRFARGHAPWKGQN